VSEPIRNADDAIRFLDGLINRERLSDGERAQSRFSLAPIRNLLAAVGHPERGLSIIHVAGSKGKGSTCLFGEAISRELGERTGVFLSPHLERWTERFRIDGREVDDATFAAAVERVRPHITKLREAKAEEAPSFFDALTAVALLLFADAGVDRVWLEVGLGGRLDSTNAITPAVTCITSIELEHTQVLGDTLAEIAREKAGILKDGVPAVIARLAPEAGKAVEDCAASCGASLRVEGDAFDFATQSEGPSALVYRDADLDFRVELGAIGEAQARCAALAIACLRALGQHDASAVEAAAMRALPPARLPGRIEVVVGEPRVVLDSAHTKASAQALASALTLLHVERAQLVLSVSEGKDLISMLRSLLPFASRVWATCADADRSFPARVLAACVRETDGEIEIRVEDDPKVAVANALEAAGFGGAVVVTGSVYIAGIARGELRSRGRISE
jgi:dihydrofolate synthase/folylpolyglutamate synthase